MVTCDTVIIGAGPAGLTAGYLLSKENQTVVILEADPDYVGGIARTVTYKNYCFDIGGHRFFSKSKEVEDFWTEILPNDMLSRPRSSRIFYNHCFFAYPLKFLEVLYKLGPIQSARCCLSYLKVRLFPITPVRSFSDWVTNHFGERLFNIFFKTYTEKVWGMRCDEISADWAAQRIKGLSLITAIMNALTPKRKQPKQGAVIKTLIDSFRYPRKGPGMLWEACAEKIRQMGNQVQLGQTVIRCSYNNLTRTWQTDYRDSTGHVQSVFSKHVISSAPLQELVNHYLLPAPHATLQSAAVSLKYRDFLIVVLILKDKNQFSDNWIYIHDPKVTVARIQNFKSWSPEMVPDPSMCCYGMEYFCFENDGLWAKTDAELIEKAKQELIQIGLAHYNDITDGCIIRQLKAYPVYDANYKTYVSSIKQELEKNYPNLHLVGRNGMHKYNNQDHAMMTAMLTVKNILADKKIYDVWNVNEDAEYHESGYAAAETLESGLRAVPSAIK